MSAEQNKAVFRRVIEEGFNKGNMQALDDCFPATLHRTSIRFASHVGGVQGLDRLPPRHLRAL